jgi:osmotically-inducible protein OsmY
MKRTRSLYSIGTFIVVAAMPGCATRITCPQSGCTADEDTTAAVNAVIAAHPELGPPGKIKVATINHVVFLNGITATGLQRSTAELLAADTDGVSKVINSIGVVNE